VKPQNFILIKQMENKLLQLPVTISDRLTPAEKEALMANFQPKIKTLEQKDLIGPVESAIMKAYVVMGQNAPDTYPIVVKEVIKELKEGFSWLTVDQVCLAIDAGSKGKLDDVVFISVHNICVWIHKWNQKYRTEAIQKQKQFEEQQDKQFDLDRHKLELIKFEAAILFYYNNQSTSIFKDNYGVLSAYYRHLDKKGLILMKNSRKIEIFEEVQKNFKIAEVEQKQIDEPIDEKKTAQAIALKEIFADWFDFGYDLEYELKRNN
jgi:hypothetical protein